MEEVVWKAILQNCAMGHGLKNEAREKTGLEAGRDPSAHHGWDIHRVMGVFNAVGVWNMEMRGHKKDTEGPVWKLSHCPEKGD